MTKESACVCYGTICMMEVTQLCRLSAFQLAEMDQFGSNGIMKVTTTVILYTNHTTVTLLCPQEGKNCNILNSM